MLAAWCNDCAGVCYRSFKVHYWEERSLYPAEVSEVHFCSKHGSDADHGHALLFMSSTKCCRGPAAVVLLCICVGNRWERTMLSPWIDGFTARLIPFSDVWIINTEFDFWHLSNLAFLWWQFFFYACQYQKKNIDSTSFSLFTFFTLKKRVMCTHKSHFFIT